MARRPKYTLKEGAPRIFTQPKRQVSGYTHCVAKVACDGIELEPGRRAGGICKACMDFRMAQRNAAAAAPKVTLSRFQSHDLAGARARGGQASALARRKVVPDEKLPKRSGTLTRIGGTEMRMPPPASGRFKPIAYVLVRCSCGAEFYVKREDWVTAQRKPSGCDECTAERRRALARERDRAAREAAAEIDGPVIRQKGRAA